jgi:hypothetical protein
MPTVACNFLETNMLKITLPLTLTLFVSYGLREKDNKDLFFEAPQQTTSQKINKVDNALKFINGYVENANKMTSRVNIVEWVNSNNLSTNGFKSELKKIIDDAYKAEPEVGLDFDPILDAQDNPDKGFELEAFDENTNYLTVRGKDWQEFKLTMKIIEVNGKWLVDGCGIVNIPHDKRATR